MSRAQDIEIEVISGVIQKSGSLLTTRIIGVHSSNSVGILGLIRSQIQLTTAFKLADPNKLGPLTCSEITFDMLLNNPRKLATPLTAHLTGVNLRNAVVRVEKSDTWGTTGGTDMTGTITDIPDSYNGVFAKKLRGQKVVVLSHKHPGNFRSGSYVTFTNITLNNNRGTFDWRGVEARPPSQTGVGAKEERIWAEVVATSRGGGIVSARSSEEVKTEAILGAPGFE